MVRARPSNQIVAGWPSRAAVNDASASASADMSAAPSLDDRIVNQSAVLLTMSLSTSDLDDWFDANPHLRYAWRITVDANAEIRARLDQVNVTERVLVPGLDGLAAWLRRYYATGGVRGLDDDGSTSMSGRLASGTGQGEQH
jgi:hypothetical protein